MFVAPCLIKAQLLHYDNLDEALAMHNDVPHGLSSCIFTQTLAEIGGA